MANGKGLKSPLAQRWGLAKDIPVGEVYIGSGYAEYSGGTPTAGYAPMSDMTVSVDAAAKAFDSLSPAAMREVKRAADAAYRYDVPAINLPSFYEMMVKGAYQIQQSTGLKVTPLEYPEYMKQALGEDAFGVRAKAGAGGGYKGPVTTVSETESINLSDPSTARQFLDSALGQYLGRRPTDTEYQSFTKALNAAQEEAPSITESMTTTTPQGAGRSRVKSRQRTTGGMSEAQFATEYARSQEGAAETAAGTTGFDVFLEAIGGL